MTVLLTGATGFLGSRIAHALLTTRSEHVVVLGRGDPSRLRDRMIEALRGVGEGTLDGSLHRDLRCVSGDVTKPWLGLSPALYARLAGEVGAVWHCASDIALTGARERLCRVNVQGTAEVLAFAAVTPPACQLVHVSSIAVAGARPSGCVMESDLSGVHGFETHYDATKFEAECLVRQWAQSHGRPVVVLRPGIVAADRALPEGAAGHPLSVLGRMLESMAHGGTVGIPAQRPDAWPAVLRAGGFDTVARTSGEADQDYSVLLARRARTSTVAASPAPVRAEGNWLIVTAHPDDPTAQHLGRALTAAGAKSVGITDVGTRQPRASAAHPVGVVALLCDAAAVTDAVETVTERTELIMTAAGLCTPAGDGTSALWVVTGPTGLFPGPERCDAASPVHAAAWGVGERTARRRTRLNRADAWAGGRTCGDADPAPNAGHGGDHAPTGLQAHSCRRAAGRRSGDGPAGRRRAGDRRQRAVQAGAAAREAGQTRRSRLAAQTARWPVHHPFGTCPAACDRAGVTGAPPAAVGIV
ncbi:SDR family oxidoreductase [Streptomyces curacoi]|uniref:SDR family oxidoreductase n=1 Tax=Streptomyces curacoi TaxID=146536 RepID=UPI000A4A3F80|nr:SDR family oxidoreductase [Streptomyces curacoi]